MLLTVESLFSPGRFESLHFQNDFKCNVFSYLNKMRSFCICTTCLLSVLQAIIISPSSSYKYCWLFHHQKIVSYSVIIQRCFAYKNNAAFKCIHLFRHQKKFRYFHSTSLSPRPSPEKSATQTILLLVSFSVVIYWVDFIIPLTPALLWAYDPVVLGVQRLVGNVYATVGPFVLLRSDENIISVMKT
ncbi:PREDICTED: vomeronasal type-1 receptor 90-like, partial [Mandrillus leucophaeus]|uniref:vomeronasal type-1 receptor 90-like n=1 Tax=Mandrillus leucophaeus TaxID=9568 RepID=UPI0005F46FB1